MRISDNMRLDTMVRQQGQLQERYADASRIASSGARIDKPEDDPIGAGQAVRIQGALDRIDAFRSAIKAGQGDTNLSEGVLASAGDVFARAGEIALQAANGSLSAADRQSLSQEVDQLKSQMIDIANTKGQNGYLFGGTKTNVPPMDQNGNFQGNAADRTIEISPGVTAITSVSGALAFTAMGGRDVMVDLDSLRTALATNNPAQIAASVSALDASRRQILAARGDAGLKATRLDTADAAHQETQNALATQRHAVIDADPAGSYSRLLAMQNAIDQALAVSRNVLSTMSTNRFP
jgi:flagellar hook-associated protein 3 FlgL